MNTRLSPLLVVLTLGLGGCKDDLVPVEFYGLCGFAQSGACQPPAGKCTTYQNGQLYLFYENRDSLDMVAEMHNQRPNNASTASGGVNSANAQITEYRFKFSASPPVALSSRTVPYLTTPIGADGTSTLWIPVIPFETVAELRAAVGYQGHISVEVTPRGRFGDGSTFEVKGITIPVQVYTGAPAPFVCPDPTAVPSYCPSEFQTNSVDCSGGASTATFVLGGTISGLTGAGLVLATPGLPNLPVTAGSTTFAFAANLADAAAYNITVQTQPAGQTCTVTNGTGTVSGAAPAGITITCV